MRRAALLLVLLSGCWVPTERGKMMEQRILRLEEENQLVAKQIEDQRSAVRERVARVDEKIAEVQRKLDELNSTAHRTGADVVARQDEAQVELRKLRGLLEEEQHRLQTLEQDLTTLRTDVDGRFAALRGAGALDRYETQKKLEAVARPSDPAGYLALARQQQDAGEPGLARALYEELAKKWPSDPASAEAHYQLGELAYGEGKHREAILSFGKVAQEYPLSRRAPDAMLRTGDALVELGMKDQAGEVYADIPKRHPTSTAAQLAKKKLAALKPAKPPPAKAAPAKKKK